MRIFPALSPAATVTTGAKGAAAGSSPAGEGFEALLAPAPARPPAATPPPTRAFRFSELGILGGRGATKDHIQADQRPREATTLGAAPPIAPRAPPAPGFASPSEAVGPTSIASKPALTPQMSTAGDTPATASAALGAQFEAAAAALAVPAEIESAEEIPPSGSTAAAGSRLGVGPGAPLTFALAGEPVIVPAQAALVPQAGPTPPSALRSPADAGSARSAAPPPVRVMGRPAEAASAPAASDASLVLHQGEDGALQIVAAAPGLTAEDALRLRQRSAEVGAEFGVSVSDLYLNGAATALSPLKVLGASRAGSTR